MLELTEVQKEISKLILETPTPGKNSARSAINHITKAWEIKDIDREMAAFRAITGEEESVTAIFHTLKRRDYEGADNLKTWNHIHKSAVYPFFISVGRVLDVANQFDLEPTIELKKDTHPVRFQVRLTVKTSDGKKIWAYPDPPLHYTVRSDDKIEDFSKQLSMLANEQNAKDIRDHIRSLANKRSQILYASSEGIPVITNQIDGYILKQRDIIFNNLIVYLLIDPYKEKQLFVQQALSAFLKMLRIILTDIEFG
jgi:hypothetical protein